MNSQLYVVRKPEYWAKTLPNPKSLATFSHVLAGICTQAVVRDSEQSVAAP